MKFRALTSILMTAALAGCTVAEAPESGEVEAGSLSMADYEFYNSLEGKTSFFLEDGRCAEVIESAFRGGRDERANTLFYQYPGGCLGQLTTIDLTHVRVGDDAMFGRFYGKVLTGQGDSLVIGESYYDEELDVDFSYVTVDTYSVEIGLEIHGMVLPPDEHKDRERFIGYVAYE